MSTSVLTLQEQVKDQSWCGLSQYVEGAIYLPRPGRKMDAKVSFLKCRVWPYCAEDVALPLVYTGFLLRDGSFVPAADTIRLG